MTAAHGAVGRTTRYTLVGAACAAIYNAVMILGGCAGGGYVRLSLLAFVIVTPIGYLLHARFTFGVRRSWHDFLRFTWGLATGFPVYFLVMAGLCSGLHLAVAVAAPIATVAMYGWNYASAHWALHCGLPFGRRRHLSGVHDKLIETN